jgi:hypothetical protein
MERVKALSTPLAALVQAEEQGLDLNRLLFVKYLVLTGRLGDGARPSAPVGMDTLPLAA